MIRVVYAADGREWTVHGRVNWSEPGTLHDFELDVAASSRSGVGMLAVTAGLMLLVVWQIPPEVVVPRWLVLLAVLVVIALPVQWATGRTWTIVAETPGLPEYGLPAQRWIGSVAGLRSARREVRRVVRNLERDGAGPDGGRGRLYWVD